MNTYYPGNPDYLNSRFASSEGFPDTIVPVKRAPLGDVRDGSVGGVYPLYVMAIGNGQEHHYEVHNLQEGTVAVYGTAPHRREWDSNLYEDAYSFAERLLNGTVETTWIKA